MIVVAVVFVCLAILFIIFKQLDDKFLKMLRGQKTDQDRISSLEVHDYKQDARLDRQQSSLKHLRHDVKTMGKDVGWGDDNHKTEVFQIKPPKDP